MKIYLLQNERGQYYRKGPGYRPRWVNDPQKASVWTNKSGPGATRGFLSESNRRRGRPAPKTTVLELEIEIPC